MAGGLDRDYAFPPGFDPIRASERIRRFVGAFFTAPLATQRGEADPRLTEGFDARERALAIELLLMNLRPPRRHIIDGCVRLHATSAVPHLEALDAETESVGVRLDIRRALALITGERERLRPLLERVMQGDDARLKEVHFDDIRALGADAQIDLLIDLLTDTHSSFVRRQALRELNELEHGSLFVTGTLPHDAAYYQARRDDIRFRSGLARAAEEDRGAWPVVR